MTLYEASLLVLRTTPPVLLSSLHARLVALDLTLAHIHEATSSLPRSLQVTLGRLAPEVDLDQVALERGLERDDRLDDKRVGVLHVEVHKGHHANAHELRLEKRLQLLLVVVLDGGDDGLGLFLRTHGRGLDVFKGLEV